MQRQIFELTYGASITSDDESFLVTFRDLSNVFTCGQTHEEAIFNAVEALDGVLLEMVSEDSAIPLPSELKPDEEAISVSPEVAAPVMLHLLRKESGQTIADIAQTMEIKYQTYQRMETSGRYLTLKNLKRAARAIGATVELRFKKI
jgi:antitoxin HicB